MPGIDEHQAQGLKRVFHIDVEICQACGGAVGIIASIEDPAVIEKILTHFEKKEASSAAQRSPLGRTPP